METSQKAGAGTQFRTSPQGRPLADPPRPLPAGSPLSAGLERGVPHESPPGGAVATTDTAGVPGHSARTFLESHLHAWGCPHPGAPAAPQGPRDEPREGGSGPDPAFHWLCSLHKLGEYSVAPLKRQVQGPPGAVERTRPWVTGPGPTQGGWDHQRDTSWEGPGRNGDSGSWLHSVWFNKPSQDFPCGPAAKTLSSQCRGLRVDPWSGN